MEKNLEIKLVLNNDEVRVEFYEPESGDFHSVEFPFMPDEHPEFDHAVGMELYDWFSLMKDEEEDGTEYSGMAYLHNALRWF